MQDESDNSPLLPRKPESKIDYKFTDFVEENKETDQGKQNKSLPPVTPSREPAEVVASSETEEVYTPVPIPDEPVKTKIVTEPEKAPAPAETPAESPEKLPHRRRSLRRMVRSKPKTSFALVILLLLLVGGAAFGFGLIQNYAEKAEKFDLSEVNKIESGSIALDSKGKVIGQVAIQDRRHVKFEEVPEILIQAVIATEDNRFREHNGFDLRGIMRAFVQNLKAGGISQGGSTITQQLSRHAFDLGGRTIDRKLSEVFLSQRIEKKFNKDEILEAYLNRIYLGSGFYGVGAAAQGYFGKNVSELGLSESATLCALIKSPNRFSPFNDLQESTAARNRTLERMNALGMISDSEKVEAVESEITVISQKQRSQRPHYLLAEIRLETLRILGQYSNLSELEITTTVDLDLQFRAKKVLNTQLGHIERKKEFSQPTKSDFSGDETVSYLQGALLVLENKTGNVISAVGGRDYSDSQFDRVWQSLRAPGTALVPFVYAHALDSGKITPFSPILDAAMDNRKVMIGGTSGILGEWGTETLDNDYEGEIPAAYALVRSKNGAAVRVGQELGVESFGETLAKAGIRTELNGYSNSFLGQSPLKLLELVHAYTTFPNLGTRTKRYNLVQSIKDRDGNIIYSADNRDQPVQVMSERTASVINSVLSKTFDTNPVRLRSGGLGEGFAGKSGTSYESVDNWFIGYNADYTWGVWVGFDDPKPIYENAFGSDTALPIWLSLASSLGSEKSLPLAPSMQKDLVCLATGKQATEFCEFTPQGDLRAILPLESDTEFCDVHQNKDDTLKFETRPILKIEPDLFSGFTPVKPKVDTVIGLNPWGPTQIQE